MKSLTMRILAVMAILLFAAIVVAQSTQEYLDILQVQVKPEKRAEYDALVKKIVAANRGNQGDQWEALETMYGDGNVITYVSHRNSYGDIETGMKSFDNAMTKSLGSGVAKLFADLNSDTNWFRSELRTRRWDLSNAPSDAAARDKIIGQSRFLRTVVVHVNPGHTESFESMLKDMKEAHDKANDHRTILVSQAVAGNQGNVYYITLLEPSMAGFDQPASLRKLLGDEGYSKFQKVNAEDVAGYSVVISRFVPELSNASNEIAAAAPEFWNPKPTMATRKPMGKKTTTTATKD